MPKSVKFSFCESVTATTSVPWHIRRLTEVGQKLGGGIDTPSLCERVYPTNKPIPETRRTGLGGWDLNVEITEHHLGHACPDCVAVYRSAKIEIAKESES